MKAKAYIAKTARLGLIMSTVLNLNSCDMFIKNSETEKIELSMIKNSISIDKSEAKLLVMASQDNLDVIELCKIIEEEKADDKVKHLVEEIKEEQLQIFETYNKIALDNVISIPNHSYIKQEEDRELLKEGHLKTHLQLLRNKINHQIKLLEKLSGTTNNSEFKALAQYTNITLKDNLIKTKKTLKTLNADS